MQKTRLTEIRSDAEFQAFVVQKLVEVQALVTKLVSKKEWHLEIVIFKRSRRERPAPAETKE